MEPAIGIDLGTTNSVVAAMKDGTPVVIPNAEGDDLTPSVVAFTGNGHRWVGRLARTQALANPLRTIFSAKRHLGRAASPDVQPAGDGTIVVSSIKRQMGHEAAPLIHVDGRDYSPVEISAMILAKLKADTEAQLGQPVKRAVVTVPAYFNDSQRRATSDAAAVAGLEVARLVSEPTAAALAYGLDTENAHTVLVWDLGGGTFDVSILELGEGVFQVKSVCGNTLLGGDDYDTRLADYLAEKFRAQWNVDLGDDPAGGRLLRQLAEEAKMRLSELDETRVMLPHSFAPGNRCSVIITRKTFEEMTADITEKMVAPTYQALADAKLDPADLDRVVLVGGMTRMPAVRRLALEITGQPPCGSIDPDKVVAMGAAIQAGVLAGQVRKVTLVDVTGLSLGIETQGGLFARIIERNTPIPASRNKLFTNALDNQTAMDIRVLQGEREMAEDNMTLETFQLTGMTAQPRGQARAEITFDIDASGVVQVSATDLQTEQSSQIKLSAAGRPRPEVVEANLAESRRMIASDRRRREEVQSAIRAGNMVAVARDLIDEAGKLSDNADLNKLADSADTAADDVKSALAVGDTELISAASAKLEAAIKRLDSAVRASRTTPRKAEDCAMIGRKIAPAATVTAGAIHEQFLG